MNDQHITVGIICGSFFFPLLLAQSLSAFQTAFAEKVP